MLPSISLFVFKNKVNKRGEVKIYIRFTNNRRSSYVCTKISVPAGEWDYRKQKIKSSYRLSNAINMLLDRKVSEMREQLMIKALHSPFITTPQAKRISVRKGDLSFFSLADDYEGQLRSAKNIGTADKVRAHFNKFREFLSNKDASFYDIDENVLREYQIYLREKLNNGVNTVHSNLKSIRRVFALAVEKEIVGSDSDPFRKIKLKTEKTVRPFLTEEEIASIFALKLEPESSLDRVRDVFIWTILTGGMRISDVLLLRKSNIEGDFIITRIKKTSQPHRIKMPEYSSSVIKKFINRIPDSDGYIFGMIPNSVYGRSAHELDRAVASATVAYNKNLKKIAELAGIKKVLTSHVARITFITLAVASGVDIKTVQGLAGHADIEMTAQYSKYIDNQGNMALERLEKNFLKKI